jgi:hypothetical protein
MNEKAPWGQSTAGVFVIQGAIGPVIGAVAGVALTLSLTHPENIDWPHVALIGLALAVAVFILLSFILRKLRGLVWLNVARFLKWLSDLRVTTRSGREKLKLAGREERSREVREERKTSPRPHWRVTHNDGDDAIYVHNSGYAVDDVVVGADPELFEFPEGAEQGFIKGRLGDNLPGGSTGIQVPGCVTRRGEREGVKFTFSWTDQNGDAQPMAGVDDLPTSASLAPRALKPVMRPTWQIGRPKQSASEDVLILVNGADGFVGKDVIIDADPTYFTFIRNRELQDLSGRGGLLFAGRPTEAGKVLGVTFEISYTDVNGDEHIDHVPKQFGMGWGL